MESYVERPPLRELAGAVRTVWIQRTDETPYVQRHLPTGGVEIHFPIGGLPHLVGPLTGPEIEVIPAHTTIVGVRFQPGTAPPLPTALDDLVDQRLSLAELWGGSVDRLVGAMAGAGTPERALMCLQTHLLQEFRTAVRPDPLVGEAVKVLMPWHPVDIGALATHLALSTSQLRRRCLHAVGVSPKILQRTLRFDAVPDVAEFRNALDGKVFSPDSPGYEAIRRPVNAAYWEVRPRPVILCRSVSDVVRARPAAVKHAYDPHRFFDFRQAISPTSEGST